MCTLTWGRDEAGGLEVFFNRDERKTRPVAEPPALDELNGVRFLSPRDPKGGGAWMIANELGLGSGGSKVGRILLHEVGGVSCGKWRG